MLRGNYAERVLCRTEVLGWELLRDEALHQGGIDARARLVGHSAVVSTVATVGHHEAVRAAAKPRVSGRRERGVEAFDGMHVAAPAASAGRHRNGRVVKDVGAGV